MRCRYNDCGWCYAPESISTNDQSGQCQTPKDCPSFNCYNEVPQPLDKKEVMARSLVYGRNYDQSPAVAYVEPLSPDDFSFLNEAQKRRTTVKIYGCSKKWMVVERLRGSQDFRLIELIRPESFEFEGMPDHCIKPTKEQVLSDLAGLTKPSRKHMNYFNWLDGLPLLKEIGGGRIEAYYPRARLYAQQEGWIK